MQVKCWIIIALMTNNLDNSNPQAKSENEEGLVCDNCGFFPIKAEHAHFICPACHYKTKCCEGGVC